MVLAEVPERIIDVGTWAGVIVAVIGAARTAPGRWLWRRLVERPVGEWLDGKHAQAIAPVVERLDVQGVELAAQGVRLSSHLVKEEGDVSRIDGLLEVGDERMGRLEEGQAEIQANVAEMRGELAGALAALTAGNPEVRQPAHDEERS